MNAEFLRIDFFRVYCLASEHFVAASAHASHPIVSRLLAKASTPYNLEAQDRVMQSRPGRLTCWRVLKKHWEQPWTTNRICRVWDEVSWRSKKIVFSQAFLDPFPETLTQDHCGTHNTTTEVKPIKKTPWMIHDADFPLSSAVIVNMAGTSPSVIVRWLSQL